MKSRLYFLFICILFFNSCIGTDIIQDEIEPTLRINNPISSLVVGANYHFTNIYLNNVGVEETVTSIWASSDSTVISIDPTTGFATALKTGQSNIRASISSGTLISSSVNTITIVPASLSIENKISVLSIDETYMFDYRHFDTASQQATATIAWASSDKSVISIDATTGIATAIKEGTASISVQTTNRTPILKDEILVEVKISSFKINNPISTLIANDTYQFTTLYTDAAGLVKTVDLQWSSSDNTIISINNSGVARGLKKGIATITASTINTTPILRSEVMVSVPETIEKDNKSGTIRATSSYLLQGDFSITEEANSGNLKITFDSNYKASTALPGLFIYLGNNPNSIGSAYEIGAVKIFNGSHSYTLPSSIKLDDYKYILYWCKPFGVKVGDGEIK